MQGCAKATIEGIKVFLGDLRVQKREDVIARVKNEYGIELIDEDIVPHNSEFVAGIISARMHPKSA